MMQEDDKNEGFFIFSYREDNFGVLRPFDPFHVREL